MIFRGDPKAYFEMNRHSVSLPLSRVDQILSEVVRRVSRSRAGEIGFSLPERNGRYALAFTSVDAANVFERLCRDAGGSPRRSNREPRGLLLVGADTAMFPLPGVKWLDEFTQAMRKRQQARYN